MTDIDLPTATAVDYDPFADGALPMQVPVTPAQREIWLACQLEPAASLAYNEAIAITLHGPLDAPALQRAVSALVQRHEALRATFSADGASMLIAEAASLPLVEHDLSDMAPSAADAAVAMACSRMVTDLFDLQHGPLVRAERFGLPAGRTVLLLCAHHIVCDGWSFGVLVRDLSTLYADEIGLGSGTAAADSFAAYALEQVANDEQREADLRHWTLRFQPLPPPLDLPLDHSRGRRRTFASRREDRTLDAHALQAVRAMGAAQGASLYATLLAGFAAWLHRLAGQDDVVIGVPAAAQAHEGLDGMVGHGVHVLPLRSTVRAGDSFAALLERTRAELLDAFDHPSVALGDLLGQLSLPRDPARLPLVSVLFNLDARLDESMAQFPGLRFEVEAVPREYENFELFVNAVQVDGGLRLECQYNAGLFEGVTIQAWLDGYVNLLMHAALDASTDVEAMPLVSDTIGRQLAAMQPAATPFPAQRLAHEFFEQQAGRSPDRTAVRHADRTLSYAALEARANRVAHALRDRGIGRGSLVGICMGRGTDMLAAVLGVLKSGAGYVPMDPAFPPARLEAMAEDAVLAAVLTETAAPLPFRYPQARQVPMDGADVALADASRPDRDTRAATPVDVAYVIFTSGSTGRPKGVRVPHRALSNFLTSTQRVPGIVPDDRVLAVTTLSFDIAFMELMLPLTSGAEVVIAGQDDVRDGAQLCRLLEECEATMMQATPTGWRLLLEAGWRGRAGFRAVSGGEPLPVDVAEALLERCGEVWNGYGPTETTIYSTFWRVDDPRERILIGRPIANTSVHVLDAHGHPCPPGVAGEIHIGGAGVALDYLARPELTHERFVADPWSEVAGARMYRTGDRGRWLHDGMLEHLGRLDHQVKVRGYRIEPGEVECALTDRADVARAVVMAREDRANDVRLVAYVVPAPGAALAEDALRQALRQRLPEWMVPQHVMVLPALPQLPNGKVDRSALPPPSPPVATEARPRVAPRNDLERRVADAMQAVLCLPGLDVRDDFFLLGGHSLLAARLTAQINREFGIHLSFRTLFDAPTVERLAHVIATERSSGQHAPLAPIGRSDDQRTAPLTLMQQRLWSLHRMYPDRVTYNAPSAHRLRGALDAAAFDQAFQALLARQPSLRTTFSSAGGDGEVRQVIADSLQHPLFPAVDLGHLQEDAREAALMQQLRALTDTPFDLERGPLFSARMFRLGDDEHVLFFMPHHIIWDGWSFDIFYDELSALYRAFRERRASPLVPLPVSYGDYARWHAQWLASDDLQAQLRHWRQRLAQVDCVEPLPTDHPRRPGMAGTGRTEWIRLDANDTRALHDLATSSATTVNMVLLSLYALTLCRLSERDELMIGTPVRGRNHPEVEAVMGYFNHLLPLHVAIDRAATFREFTQQVKAVAVEAFGHPDVPLEYLQREMRARHGAQPVLYHALFSFQDARQRSTDWGGLQHEQVLLFQGAATEDMGLWFLEHAQGMVGGVTYNADLYDEQTAVMVRERYVQLLRQVCLQPETALDDLLSPSDEERARLGRGMPPGAAAVHDPAGEVASSPSGESELLLASVWRELLGTPSVSANDNFFDAGGHSLLAVEMAERVRALTGVRLNLLDVANGTLGTLAADLALARANTMPPAATHAAGVWRSLGRWFGRH
jgi:amino acid adenylation domain-containing protein